MTLSYFSKWLSETGRQYFSRILLSSLGKIIPVAFWSHAMIALEQSFQLSSIRSFRMSSTYTLRIGLIGELLLEDVNRNSEVLSLQIVIIIIIRLKWHN